MPPRAAVATRIVAKISAMGGYGQEGSVGGLLVIGRHLLAKPPRPPLV